jgi:hypothetical protein
MQQYMGKESLPTTDDNIVQLRGIAFFSETARKPPAQWPLLVPVYLTFIPDAGPATSQPRQNHFGKVMSG